MLDAFLNQFNEEIYIASTMMKFKEPSVIQVDENGREVIENRKEDSKEAKKRLKSAKKEE